VDNTGQSLDPTRDKLVRSLDLTQEQQGKLDPILREREEKLLALKGDGLSKTERRSRKQTIREAAQAQIMQILTAEQRGRFEASEASTVDQPEARGDRSGHVWVQGVDGEPRPLTVQLGLADANFTEVLGGELREGQEVIVGSVERPAPRAGKGQAPGSALRF